MMMMMRITVISMIDIHDHAHGVVQTATLQVLSLDDNGDDDDYEQ